MSTWSSSVPTEEFIPGIYAQILTAFLHISKNQRQVSFETQEKTENMSRYPTLSRNCLEQNIPLLVHDWQVCSYKRSILWYCYCSNSSMNIVVVTTCSQLCWGWDCPPDFGHADNHPALASYFFGQSMDMISLSFVECIPMEIKH